MKKQVDQTDLERRQFLRGSAVAGAGMVAMTMLSKQAVAEAPKENEEKPKGYRLTNHILAYYKTAAS